MAFPLVGEIEFVAALNVCWHSGLVTNTGVVCCMTADLCRRWVREVV